MKMQKNEKIKLCGVARAFVQFSENGPRFNKFGHPCTKGCSYLLETTSKIMLDKSYRTKSTGNF